MFAGISVIYKLETQKATDALFQSLKISPLPPLITGDPLPRFIPGPLNLQIKHWAALLKVLLLTDLCFVSLVQCLFSEHLSPACVRRAACAVLYFIKSLLILNMSRVHIAPKCETAIGSAATHPPCVKSIGWTVLDIIKMQTDRQTDAQRFLPLLEKNMSPLPPKLRIFGVDYYRSFEAQKMVFGSRGDSRIFFLMGWHKGGPRSSQGGPMGKVMCPNTSGMT